MKIHKILLTAALFTLLFITACAPSQSNKGQIVQHRVGTSQSAAAAKEAIEATEASINQVDTGDLYMISQVDTEQSIVMFTKVSNGKQTQYGYTLGTEFFNKYGSTKSISSFLPGDVVNIEVSGRTGKLQSVKLSDKVWVNEKIHNFSIDPEIGAFTIGRTKYSYDAELPIFSGNTSIDMNSISSQDILRAVGVDKKLISLSVVRGHGYLNLSNTKLFDGSFICVGDKIFQEVKADLKIEVPEGDYKVTVANNGYGGSKDITVERGDNKLLDLDELKGEGPKFCKITFEIGIEGAVLAIDGKAVDYSQPTEVQYGTHSISVTADGYDTVSQQLVVNSKEATIQIGLTQAEDTESKSDSSSSNNSSNNSNSNNNDTNNNTDNNTNNSTNNNTNNNNNSNTDSNNDSNSSTTDTSSTDYLTTLYNLLNSINSGDIKDE